MTLNAYRIRQMLRRTPLVIKTENLVSTLKMAGPSKHALEGSVSLGSAIGGKARQGLPKSL